MNFSSSLLLIDVVKILAAQLIVWHHLFAYSPMADVVQPHFGAIADWLFNDARLAVQVFLVIGGFLAARSLAPQPGTNTKVLEGKDVLRQVWQRYLRLALPYVIALGLAIVCAAIARAIAFVPDTPAKPTFLQLLSHLLLLQDIYQFEALSAGVWYVAIDFQLYATFVLILWVAGFLTRSLKHSRSQLVGLITIAMCGLSLFWLNRDSTFDVVAPYFFGAYGLGILAHWAVSSTKRWYWLATMVAICSVALLIEWRSRVAVALLTASALVVFHGVGSSLQHQVRHLIAKLGTLAYPQFLMHYPVMLVVNAAIFRFGSRDPWLNTSALLLVWMGSIAGAKLLTGLIENVRSPMNRLVAILQFRFTRQQPG